MSLADEHTKRAAGTVLTHALLNARILGFEGSSTGLSAQQSQQLGDLMDAVHNIPELLLCSADCYRSLLASMLRDLKNYDMEWGTSLVAEYERVLSGCAG